MPVQAAAAKGIQGRIEGLPACGEGLQDLEGFSHLILLYVFHRARAPELLVKPFLGDRRHGVFATRAPARPNPIGISVVRLVRVDGLMLHIEDVDVVDGTPLLDIKPYVPAFDVCQAERTGWLAEGVKNLDGARSDDRFTAK